ENCQGRKAVRFNVYRRLPIKRKLQFIIMMTVGAALTLACTAIVAYDQIEYRKETVNDLLVEADIFANTSTAALEFGDQKTASQIIATLKAERHITAAVIYDAGGAVFASYVREPGHNVAAIPAPQTDHTWFEGGYLKVLRSIELDRQVIGKIYIESDLE